MRKTVKLFVLLFCILSGRADLWGQADYLTVYSLSVGEILDSPGHTFILPDGAQVTTNLIGIGSANPANNNFRPDFGAYNTNIFGGYFDGIDNANANNVGSASSIGITLGGYQGSKVAGLFTRIVSNRGVVDNGNGTNYRNAIGLYIHTSTPQILGNFLMMDFDGTTGDNREWASSFAYRYNGASYNAINPVYKTSSNTVLTQLSSVNVNSTWESMVQGFTNSSVSLSQQNIIRKTGNVDDIDPDDTSAQVVINYDTAKTTDVFFLWGIVDQVVNGGQQNSGLSPLVFKYNFDFGDAPGYNTLLNNTGARHLWYNVVTNLYLGASVNREADGDESSPTASSHSDDDGRMDDTLHLNILAGSLQVAYDTFKYKVSYTNNSGKKAWIAAWMDWDGNGKFSAEEGLVGTTAAGTTNGTYTFTWTNQILKRKTLQVDKTFIRIRYTTDSMSIADFQGVKSDGEVEDYSITISNLFNSLPVTMSSFDVKSINHQVICSWDVVNQKDIEKYTVLKSMDGRSYKEIGSVKANDEPACSYQYADATGDKLPAYYKLAAHELDGHIEYSAVRHLNNYVHEAVNIYPNPAKNKINITMSANGSLGKIYNMAGQLMHATELSAGLNTVDVSSFPDGLYFLVTLNNAAGIAPVQTKFEVKHEQ